MEKQTRYFFFFLSMLLLVNIGCKKDLLKKTLADPVSPYYVTILAGADDEGFVDGTGTNSRLSAPRGITAFGDYVYVTDQANNAVRRFAVNDASVTTLAGGSQGFANGTGAQAKFNNPIGIAAGPDGSLYVTDFGNFKIRKITPGGLVSTFAGCDSGHVNGPVKSSATAPMAEFGYLLAIAVSKDGTIFVYDYSAARIRKISTAGIVSDFAGSVRGDEDGSATTAKFDDIESIAIASDGTMYIATARGNEIKKITTDGTVTTIAGGGTVGYQDGPALTAKFMYPYGIAIAADGSLYVTDESNHYIRKISTTGIVSTVAGIHRSPVNEQPATSGPGNAALLYYPLEPVILNNILYFTESNEITSLSLP